jgi:UDP-3-O-[3-hydroxymyristoyl] glucosamine N-acyltransferase
LSGTDRANCALQRDQAKESSENELMEHTLEELARVAGGTVDGDPTKKVRGARSLDAAGPEEIAFLDHAHRFKVVEGSNAGAFLVPLDTPPLTRPVIRVNEPLSSFIKVARLFQKAPAPRPVGVDHRAAVDPTAIIGERVVIHPFAVIGYKVEIGDDCEIHPGVVVSARSRIGRNCILHPHAVLYEDTVLGDRVVIHAGTVIGADGFGYRLVNKVHEKIPQLGNVEVGNDCEIGACTTVDRGTFGPTQLGAGSKIDNLVQVGHNCRIGANNLIVSQTGIAGSCTTGAYVVIAGQVGLADHVTLADGTVVGAKSGVMRNSQPGERLLGAPARPERDEKRILISLEKLPETIREVKRLTARHVAPNQLGEQGS